MTPLVARTLAPVQATPKEGTFHSLLVRALTWLLLAAAAGCGGSPGPTAPTRPSDTAPATGFSEASFRAAAAVTADAQIAVLSAIRPGQVEGDVKRVADATFLRAGAVPAFPHIVASGPNTLSLHYDGDSGQLIDGDTVLIDIGASVDGHCSDVTRTYAVSGRFTPRQREIYDLVLDVQQTVAAQARTGADTIQTINARARALFAASPLRARDEDGVERTMERFFTHGLAHFVGRLVHGEDTGWSGTEPFRAGQVLAIEPGLYIRTELLGVRIEDTYLVTTSGLECLTCASPK